MANLPEALNGREARDDAAAGLQAEDTLEWVSFADDAEVARYVFSLNLERRHLNSSQRAMAGARLLPMFEEAARERQAHGKTAPGQTLPANWPEALNGREARDDAAAGLQAEDTLEWVSFADDAEVARYVFSLNLERRHLNSSQRAMAGARLLPMFEEAARARQGARSDLTSVPIGTEVRVHRADEEAADDRR